MCEAARRFRCRYASTYSPRESPTLGPSRNTNCPNRAIAFVRSELVTAAVMEGADETGRPITRRLRLYFECCAFLERRSMASCSSRAISNAHNHPLTRVGAPG
jgi:hypothetical protein